MFRLAISSVALFLAASIAAAQLPSENDLKNQAAAALGEPAPPPLLPGNSRDVQSLMGLPRQTRVYSRPHRPETVDHYKLRVRLCRRYDVFPCDREVPASLQADAPEIDFAPMARGFAVLTISMGNLKAKGGTPDAFPVIFVLDADGMVIDSFAGEVVRDQAIAAVELSQEAESLRIQFFTQSRGCIGVEWRGKDGESISPQPIEIDRNELVESHARKSKEDRAEIEKRVKQQRQAEVQAAIEKMDMKEWRRADGSSAFAGEFQGYDKGNLSLLDATGELIVVAASDLDASSRQQLQRIVRERRDAARSKEASPSGPRWMGRVPRQ